MLLEDFFEYLGTYGSYDTQEKRVATLADEVDIITAEDSELVVAARELRKAQSRYDAAFKKCKNIWIDS